MQTPFLKTLKPGNPVWIGYRSNKRIALRIVDFLTPTRVHLVPLENASDSDDIFRGARGVSLKTRHRITGKAYEPEIQAWLQRTLEGAQGETRDRNQGAAEDTQRTQVPVPAEEKKAVYWGYDNMLKTRDEMMTEPVVDQAAIVTTPEPTQGKGSFIKQFALSDTEIARLSPSKADPLLQAIPIHKSHADTAARVARHIFAGKPGQVEMHISEAELALYIGLAFFMHDVKENQTMPFVLKSKAVEPTPLESPEGE